MLSEDDMDILGKNMGDTLYFVDGYHGGVEGHMPDGAFEDILDALERLPEWKVSFEVEPESWNDLKRKDPTGYRRLKAFIENEKTAGRIEFVSGAYGQPFCWAINGESNIRHLRRGVEEIRKHFPNVVIDTYAVQEPCFSSCMPQICKKLGYERMSLKNPTSWGGYMQKMSGEIVRMESHDGSALPGVPRYECEELVSCSATEAAGYDFRSIDGFAEKCVKNGIAHPVGMCFQDLGWKAGPIVTGKDVEHVTWREYFERFCDEPEETVQLNQDQILCALPWGNLILQQMCRKVRKLEWGVLQTEKLLSFVETQKGRQDDLQRLLRRAWDELLLVQHHDGYICATTGGSPFGSWKIRADYRTMYGEQLLKEIHDRAMELMQEDATASEDVADEAAELVQMNAACVGDVESQAVAVGGARSGALSSVAQYVRVYNTTGGHRDEIVSVDIALPKGSQGVRVTDTDGKLCQAQPFIKRLYDDQSPDAVRVSFSVCIDGVGYRTYCIEPVLKKNVWEKPLAKQTVQDTIEVENDCIFAVFDKNCGGALVKLVEKKTGRDFVTPGSCMGYFRGFLVEKNAFYTTKDKRAEGEILENGPLYTKIRFRVKNSICTVETTYEIFKNSARIDVQSLVIFPEKTEIGYPWKSAEDEEYYDRKRSGYREDYKFGVQFPLPKARLQVIKHAPYDNFVSQNTDTRFLGWDEIKNNIFNQFLDFYLEEEDCGLAVLCDHVTGYSLVDNQFALTQAFGYYGGFWWGYQPVVGTSEIGYSILVHAGDYLAGEVASHNSRKNEPLLPQLLAAKPEVMEKQLFYIPDPDFELVSIFREDDQMYARIFHHGMQPKHLKYVTTLPEFLRTRTDLNGKTIETQTDVAAPCEVVTIK